MIDRRALMIGLGLAGLVVRSTVHAQPAGKSERVGYISSIEGSTPVAELWRKAFVDGLRDHGWTENQNVIIERRYAELRSEASQAVVEDLIRTGVDVIVVSNTLTALAAKRATTRLPIVVTVDKILRGAAPGLKTATALGLTLPQSLLIRADEIIR
jgi:putative tryptophan/tyrosine transport system substrate-binding protein